MAALCWGGENPSLDKDRLRVQKSELNLWARLPKFLEEEILAKVPISSLLPLRGVCKKWRDLILFSKFFPRFDSAHGHLVYFYRTKILFVQTSRNTGTWVPVSLRFLPLKRDRLRDLVTSEGGLLCFRTFKDGEFILCNPLTKRYRKLQVPCREASKIAGQPSIPEPSHSWLFSNRIMLLVGLVVDSDTGHFKLIAGGLHRDSQGTTLVYDSRVDSWKKVGHIPDSVVKAGGNRLFRHRLKAFPLAIEKIAWGGNLYFHLEYPYRYNFIQMLVKYDVEKQAWFVIEMPRLWLQNAVNYSCNFVQHDGRMLVVIPTKPAGSGQRYQVTCEVWELQEDIGFEYNNWQWMPANDSPFSTVDEEMHNRTRVTCLGQGDVNFLIRRDTSFSCGLKQPTDIREWFHDVSTNSDVVSDWNYVYQQREERDWHHIPPRFDRMGIQIFTWSTKGTCLLKKPSRLK